jgi:hypothetical protein
MDDKKILNITYININILFYLIFFDKIAHKIEPIEVPGNRREER